MHTFTKVAECKHENQYFSCTPWTNILRKKPGKSYHSQQPQTQNQIPYNKSNQGGKRLLQWNLRQRTSGQAQSHGEPISAHTLLFWKASGPEYSWALDTFHWTLLAEIRRDNQSPTNIFKITKVLQGPKGSSWSSAHRNTQFLQQVQTVVHCHIWEILPVPSSAFWHPFHNGTWYTTGSSKRKEVNSSWFHGRFHWNPWLTTLLTQALQILS